MSYFKKKGVVFEPKSWSGTSFRSGASFKWSLKNSWRGKSCSDSVDDPVLDNSFDFTIGSFQNSSRSSVESMDIYSPESLQFASSIGGKMHENEDRWVMKGNLGADGVLHRKGSAESDQTVQFLSETSLFAAIDGHDGSGCSQFICDNLAKMVVTCKSCECENSSDKLSAIMEETFSKLEVEFEAVARKTVDTSGACLVMALCWKNWICVGNVGDCLAVVYDHSKKIHYASKLHRSIVAEERSRVESTGGYVHRGRVFGQMIPSRTIGDFDIKKSCPGAVIATPYISTLEIKKRKETLPLLILATDGLWDIYDGKTACKAARKYLKQRLRKDFAVDPSVLMCDHAVKGGTKDDITTVLVKL